MRGVLVPVAAAVFACGTGSTALADVAMLETLYCVPDLSPTRVLAEFSMLLDGSECSWTMAKTDLGSHLLGINECRTVPAMPGTDYCKIFSFQINNMNSPGARPSVPRFVLKGSGRWCHRTGGGWAPAEPDHFLPPQVASRGAQLSEARCPEPEAWIVRTASVVPPPAPPPIVVPTPPVTPPAVTQPPPIAPPPPVAAPPSVAALPSVVVPRPIAPPPPPPKAVPAPSQPLCRGAYVGVCSNLASLRYLASAVTSDADLRRAVREFQIDEREPVVVDLPPVGDLLRSTAAALARSKAAPACAVAPGVVGCGKS